MFSQCGSDPDSPSMSRRMRGWNSSSEDGSVPIKVVHERTPPRSSNNDDGTDSETSSQASHGSQGSTSSQPQRARITREPRVHHIPIMVEPREGSTSSGYASDGATEIVNHDSEHQDQQSEERATRNVQNLCKNFEGQPGSPRINSVPIRLNGGRADSPNRTIRNNVYEQHEEPPSSSANLKSEAPGPNVFHPTAPPRQRSRGSPQPSSPQANGGPHITRINMNMENIEPPMQVPEPQKPEKKVKTGVDPLSLIDNILKEVAVLEKNVETFSGTAQNKNYRYLDEMLTRCMLKLDDIDTEGRDDIRQSRKAAVREVQKCINLLESKICNTNSSTNCDENMEAETSIEEAMEEIRTDEERGSTELQKSSSEKMEVTAELQKTPSQAEVESKNPEADETQKMDTSSSELESKCEQDQVENQTQETEKLTDQLNESEVQSTEQ